MRQHFVEALYAGQSFREVLRDLGLTSNQVWGLAKTDQEWSEKLEAALTATRRNDLQHGTTPRTWRVASAASAGSISASGWLGCADHQFSSMRILGSCFGLRLSIHIHFAVEGWIRRSNSGVLNGQCTLLLAFLVVAASIVTAVQANAAGTVYIYKVYYNSPGSDTGSNSSLNAEYVVIRNGDNASHSISGWTVRDAAGHRYTFPDGFRLGAGKQAIIHTGKDTSYTTSASTHPIGVGARMCGTTRATR